MKIEMDEAVERVVASGLQVLGSKAEPVELSSPKTLACVTSSGLRMGPMPLHFLRLSLD